VEISGFDGSEVSVLLQGVEEEALSACYAIVLVDRQGASMIDSGSCSVTEAKRRGQKQRSRVETTLTPSELDKDAISGLAGSLKLSSWYPEQRLAGPEFCWRKLKLPKRLYRTSEGAFMLGPWTQATVERSAFKTVIVLIFLPPGFL
jgi:hypothetical protein